MTNENIFSKGITTLKEEGPKPFLEKSFRFSARLPFKMTRKIFPGLYYPLAEKFYRKTNEFDTDNWEAPLNPYKVIWVDPVEIEEMTGRKMLLEFDERIKKFGNVEEGEWDISENVEFNSFKQEHFGENKWAYNLLIDKKFENTVFFQSCKNHFEKGTKWEETEFYKKIIKGFEESEAGIPGYGTNKEELKRNLSQIDRLYDDIKEKGVKIEENINKRSFQKAMHWSILVDISRSGKILFFEGRRRLSIAKILEVDKVPVRVQVRHPEWMDYRDRVFNEELDDYHPDFSEFQ